MSGKKMFDLNVRTVYKTLGVWRVVKQWSFCASGFNRDSANLIYAKRK
jgi:hypothetical protein